MCILEFFWTVSCNSYNLICLSQLNLARTMSCSLYSVGSGSWVTDGISTTDNTTKVGNVTSVHCLSTHLTSFAVLVDVAGGLQVCAGCRNMAECSYSWLCFLVGYTRSGAQSLADCFIHWMCNFNNLPYYCCGVLYIARVRLRKATKIIYKYRYWCVYTCIRATGRRWFPDLEFMNSWYGLYRKKLFRAVHTFVHLNLAISLLLGYLTFMAGIESATRSIVSIEDMLTFTVSM